jgi:putative ABC transport system substrate-binding protein
MPVNIGRRELIAALGSAAAAWPLAAGAQQSAARLPRIGIIDNSPIWDNFRQGLRDLGYIEGQSIVIDYRSAEGKIDRLNQAAGELASLPVNVIAVAGSTAARAAQRATSTIPIVMIAIGDPVRAGFTASLARPSRNMTGTSFLTPDLIAKRLEIMKECIPGVARMAFLWNPDNDSNLVFLEELIIAVPALGLKLISVPVRNIDEFESAFAAMMKREPNALVATGDFFHQRYIDLIINFAVKNRLPSSHGSKEDVIAGGLMSYGANLPDAFRHSASYVHKILQGALPAELPIEQPTKFELAFNLKTAKLIGVTVPPTLLARADEVIE